MTEYNPLQDALDGLSAIEQLIDDGRIAEAVDAYEQWAYQHEHRVVDIGGSFHLKVTPRRIRRRNRKGRR